MLKMSDSGENHSDFVFIRRLDRLIVPFRAAWLNYRLNPGFGRTIDPVSHREECIRGHDRALDRKPFVGSLDRGDLGAVHTAHLASTDADRHVVLAENDRV